MKPMDSPGFPVCIQQFLHGDSFLDNAASDPTCWLKGSFKGS